MSFLQAPSPQLGPSIVIWINSLASTLPSSNRTDADDVDGGGERGGAGRRVAYFESSTRSALTFSPPSFSDPAYFRPLATTTKQKTLSENWVLRFNNLKRLYKLLIRYYEDVLRSPTVSLPTPNLQVIAKSDPTSDVETCRLAGLVLALAVCSEKRQFYVEKIQSLDEWVQRELMISIEQVMSRIKTKTPPLPSSEMLNDREAIVDEDHDDGDSEFYALHQDRSRLLSDKDALQIVYEELLRAHRTLQEDHEEALSAVAAAEVRANEAVAVVEANRAERADAGYKAELDRMRQALQQTEDQLSEAEQIVEKQSRIVEELQTRVEVLEPKAAEATKLKDQMDEYRHAVEKAKKAENVIEKYKKKLEDSADLRKSLRTLEEQNSDLLDRYGTLEEEHAKLAAFKPLMDSYKNKIDTLEGKSSTLTKENDKLRLEIQRATEKLKIAQEKQNMDREALGLYEERVHELEAGPTPRKAPREDVVAEDDDEDSFEVRGELDDAFRGTTMTDLKLQVRKLKRQLNEAMTNSAEHSRVVVLENLLEDANRTKAKYEMDYLRGHRERLGVEAKLEEIISRKSRLGDGPEAAIALRMRLNETVEELERLRHDRAKLDVEYAKLKDEHTIAKSDLILVNRDQLDILKSLRASVATEKEALTAEVERLKTSLRDAEDKVQMQMSQVNTLLMDKVSMQNDGISQRKQMLEQEKESSHLRTSLMSKNMSEEDRARVGALQEENDKAAAEVKDLKEKLLKAKAFIKNQDKLLRERHAAAINVGCSETFGTSDGMGEEAEQAQRSQIAQLKEDLERQKNNMAEVEARYRREQQLMLSAWHELGMCTMREGVANAGHTKSQPASWMGQQRLRSNGNGLRYG
ncbi:BZ3500_MvSof-1268-A1-R1_Chr8-2g10125 [Microbotryum saponariae]|uniref:BZ3500_MvSof-1268-A1-R1_Chr8-2g10125 protein n=1 Tax=Microbotryum saponariae TaxID=289078 RepID=A0A2X0L5E4_9BASI|nr:BZ3500_MvSof-1268-A1-R1_Chr8-2g10125 [Microbotryum saponariae]SDA01834.1 BZ3501_MvSof-1269-A2-R1_Chr8-2g09876 [Microbotryum saponariae]